MSEFETYENALMYLASHVDFNVADSIRVTVADYYGQPITRFAVFIGEQIVELFETLEPAKPLTIEYID